MKLSVICRVQRREAFETSFEPFIIHTGQHYDKDMSAVFISELELPDSNVDLSVSFGSHAEQTGEMMKRLEPVLTEHQTDCVRLYGDTNWTVAAALVCAKRGVPAGHVEAGLNSFNRRMPDEINRLVADHLSDFLFCSTAAAMGNLDGEGLKLPEVKGRYSAATSSIS